MIIKYNIGNKVISPATGNVYTINKIIIDKSGIVYYGVTDNNEVEFCVEEMLKLEVE